MTQDIFWPRMANPERHKIWEILNTIISSPDGRIVRGDNLITHLVGRGLELCLEVKGGCIPM